MRSTICGALAGAVLLLAACSSSDASVKDWAVDRQIKPGVKLKVTKLPALPSVTGPDNARFHYFGGHASRAGANYPDNAFFRSDSVSGTAQLPPYFVTFKTSDRKLRILTKGTGGRVRIRVNDRLVSVKPRSLPVTGSLYQLTVKFRSRATRKVVLEMGNGFYFGGVVGKVTANRSKLGKRVIFVGDSFTEPEGALAPTTGYAHRAGFALGWGDTWASGSGGTGYLNPGNVKGRVTIGDRLQNDVLRYKPDTVVLAAGLNDVGRYPTADAAAAARRVIDRVKAAGIDLVVLGPFWPGDPSAQARELDAAIQAQAEAAGARFISPIQEQWITNATAAEYIGGDGTHPTPAGHDHIAARLASGLQQPRSG